MSRLGTIDEHGGLSMESGAMKASKVCPTCGQKVRVSPEEYAADLEKKKRSILRALTELGNRASANKLARHLGYSSGHDLKHALQDLHSSGVITGEFRTSHYVWSTLGQSDIPQRGARAIPTAGR